jgi:hypothetical protein
VLHPSLIAKAGTENEREDQASRDAEIDLQSLIAQFTSGETGVVDEAQANFAARVLDSLQVEDDQECPVCMEVMDPPVLAPKCMHKAYVKPFYGPCIVDMFIAANPACLLTFMTALKRKSRELALSVESAVH